MQDEFNDPLWRQVLSGSQMLFVAFGALVLMPLITGMDPNVALFTAGIGTLLFQLATGRQVPVFLASSFAFIAPIIAAKGEFGLPAVLGGVVAAGFVYMFLGLAVKLKGPGFIDRILPPVVIGPVIIAIGLALSPVAVNMAMGKTGDASAQLVPYQTAMFISMPALATTLLVAVLGSGLLRLVPIIAGIVVGCGLAAFFGVIDTTGIAAAPWLAMPNFVAPEFHLGAILYMLPVALAPAIEHIGGVIAVGTVTGKDFVRKPGLHRTLLGDGLATSAAHAQDKVKIGFITDMSSLYADVEGKNGAVAIQMAIDDFGGKVLGMPIELLTADHQNKADIAASKAREWIDTQGLTMLFGGTNSGTALASAKVAAEKKRVYINNGAASSALTNDQCTPYTVHYAYDTVALAKGTGSAIVDTGGKSWYFITADYAFGQQLEKDATRFINEMGGKVLGGVKHPTNTADFSSFALQAQSSKADVVAFANEIGRAHV